MNRSSFPLCRDHNHPGWAIDPARSILIGTSTAHRTPAAILGAGFESAS